jgi:hypothetical protein
VTVERFGECHPQLIEAPSDGVGLVGLAATAQEEVCFDGNIGWAWRILSCGVSRWR